MEISKQTKDLVISNINNLHSMQKKQTGKTQIPLRITFAEKTTKKVLKLIPSKTQTKREPQKKERHLNAILIVSDNHQYRVITDIKRTFTKVFPIEK